MTAISHLSKEPDWLMLRCQPPEQCAESIQSILKALENNERFVYAIRGEALRLFDDRQLYRLFQDPAHHGPCSCTYRWLQVYMPDSARYAQESLVNRQKLCGSVPLEIAAKIPRANLKLLENTTDSVRKQPAVQEAAQTMGEKAFAAKLSKDFNQHLEAKRTLKFTYSEGDAEQVEKFLEAVGQLLGFEDKAAQLLAFAIDWNAEHEEENDRMPSVLLLEETI